MLVLLVWVSFHAEQQGLVQRGSAPHHTAWGAGGHDVPPEGGLALRCAVAGVSKGGGGLARGLQVRCVGGGRCGTGLRRVLGRGVRWLQLPGGGECGRRGDGGVGG